MIKYLCLVRFEELFKAKWNSKGVRSKRDEANPVHSLYTNEDTEAQGSELIYPPS